jgi:hypothetical protein
VRFSERLQALRAQALAAASADGASDSGAADLRDLPEAQAELARAERALAGEG